MNWARPLWFGSLAWRAAAACARGRREGIPGAAFDSWGRRLGLRLMAGGSPRAGMLYALNPVALIRYFEFPWVWDNLPERLGDCLDVSSPRLLSLFVAERRPEARVRVINPDERDLAQTALAAERLRLRNASPEAVAVDALEAEPERYDCVWSISVIEHISGAYDDREAIRWMYGAVRPGGRLLLTFPVDRTFLEEFRERDQYGLGAPEDGSGRHFFQRRYDLDAIHQRLLAPIGSPACRMSFFGETEPGLFDAYEERAIREGIGLTVEDPAEVAHHYRPYASWQEMPGMGVCGLAIDKPGPAHGYASGR